MTNRIAVLKEADRKGWAEIRPGVYVQTAEYLQAEQKNWPDEDHCKNMDFSTAKYWVTYDNGLAPMPVVNDEVPEDD